MTYVIAPYFPGGWEWIIILIVALLIFGKRLPDVGKSLGKGIVEFKKGLKGMKDEVDTINRDVDDAVRREDEEPAEPPKLEAERHEHEEAAPSASDAGAREKDKPEVKA